MKRIDECQNCFFTFEILPLEIFECYPNNNKFLPENDMTCTECGSQEFKTVVEEKSCGCPRGIVPLEMIQKIQFTHPNDYRLQIFQDGKFIDYIAIKSPDDFSGAVGRVYMDPKKWRMVHDGGCWE